MTGLDRPLALQEVGVPRISKHLAREGGKAVSRTHWPPFLPRIYRWYSCLLEAESTPGSLSGWEDYYYYYYYYYYSVFRLTTGPRPLPKRFLHIVRSKASSFK